MNYAALKISEVTVIKNLQTGHILETFSVLSVQVIPIQNGTLYWIIF